MAQGSPLLASDDWTFLYNRLGIARDSEIVCVMTPAEAARLHKLIKAGDAAAVKAYVNNVALDEIADDVSHISRTNHCPVPRP